MFRQQKHKIALQVIYLGISKHNTILNMSNVDVHYPTY